MAHDGELQQMPRLGSHVGPDVEQHRVPAEVGEDGGDGGTIDAGQYADDEHRDGQGGARVAGRHEGGRLAVAHQLGGDA